MEKYLLKKERAFANQIFREFNKLKKLIQKTLKKYDTQKDLTEDLNKIINEFNINLALIISKRAKEVIKKWSETQAKLFWWIDFNINFWLKSEPAQQYLDNLINIHSSNIRNWSIGATTHTRIMKLIRDWFSENLSYTQIAEQITDLDPLVFSKARAENIAVSEIWQAFEFWKYRTMQEWKQEWEVIMKQWQSVHDNKVRPTHLQNESDWRINFDGRFSWTWSLIAPEGNRCRCRTIYFIKNSK